MLHLSFWPDINKQYLPNSYSGNIAERARQGPKERDKGVKALRGRDRAYKLHIEFSNFPHCENIVRCPRPWIYSLLATYLVTRVPRPCVSHCECHAPSTTAHLAPLLCRSLLFCGLPLIMRSPAALLAPALYSLWRCGERVGRGGGRAC